MPVQGFRGRYNWLKRKLMEKGELSLGEICLAWNCGPDAALKTLKAIRSFDKRVRIIGCGIEDRRIVFREVVE